MSNHPPKTKHERELQGYREQLKQLSAALTEAEERERHRIAADLHDRISQPLMAAKIQLGALIAARTDADLCNALNTVRDLLSLAIRDTRALSFEVSLPVLYELGFEAAIEWLVEQFNERHDMAITFADDGADKPLDKHIGILLFQAARELLTNSAKHARADRVHVAIARKSRTVILEVADNGSGLSQPLEDFRNRDDGGFGLSHLRLRLESVGGRLHIAEPPDGGALFTLTVPIQSAPQAP